MTEYDSLPCYEYSAEKCLTARLEKNRLKNRYSNILAQDPTLVRLSTGEYINANFIRLAPDRPRAIACQGPKDNTVSDFWRMVYESRAESICMLTDTHEVTRGYVAEKCYRYWPDVGTGVLYDKFYIRSESEIEIIPGLTATSVSIMPTELTKLMPDDMVRYPVGSAPDWSIKVHNIRLYRMTSWADTSIPDSDTPINILVGLLSTEKAPIVIHCSAGVGRTGTLAAILKCKWSGIDPFSAVSQLRQERHGMVYNREQYDYVKQYHSMYIITQGM